MLEEKTEAVLIFAEDGIIFLKIRSSDLREFLGNFQTNGSVAKARGAGRKSISDEKQLEIVNQLSHDNICSLQ